MRIMLIAPTVTPAINTIPEIRSITSTHTCLVLHGEIAIDEIYNHAQRGSYDIIHIGAHSTTYDREDVLQFVRVSGASLVFLNACHSAEMGSFLVSRGVPFVICTNIELEDREAWKMPLTFYEYLARQERSMRQVSFANAYVQAEDGDGSHAFLVSIKLIGTWEVLDTRMSSVETKLHTTVRLGLLFMGAGALLSTLLVLWSVLWN